MKFPFLGFGVGLRTRHYSHVIKDRPEIDWFEVISENYMVSGGRPLFVLREVLKHYPVVMHGVSLSLGSADPLNFDYLKKLKNLAEWVQPAWISDHLCWTGIGGKNSHDLRPLPYTEECLAHLASKIKQVQDFLERPLVIENVSSYLEYTHSTMTEWDFLSALTREADCYLLADINNIYVSAKNHRFDPATYLEALPKNRVVQFHLAGHSDKGTHLLDTHDHPVKKEVWDLYAKALKLFGPVSTLIEWDEHIPPFEGLMDEVEKAKKKFLGVYEQPFAKNRGTPLELHHRA